MVGTGLRFALAAPSVRLVAGASRFWWSGLASASLWLLPPSDSSLALPSSGDQERVTTCLNLN